MPFRKQLVVTGILAFAAAAMGQSSSLYVEDHRSASGPTPAPRRDGMVDRLSPALSRTSLAAVRLPEPRNFALHDLVTIVVRESTEARSEQSLDTNKESKFDSELKALPPVRLPELLEFQLAGSSTLTNPVKLGVNSKNEFAGDGGYQSRDSITTRVTAEIIDVKPNGNLVLEARKFIQNDKEKLELVLTGTCRSEDVARDNTVLSTQLFDLHLIKKHDGELRSVTRKGFLTKLFEFLAPF